MIQCVNGHGDLKKVVNNGIEIDYCPSCGGVWLDRGELEKLLDMARSQAVPSEDMAPNISFSKPKSSPSTQHYDTSDYEERDNRNRKYSNTHPRKKKKEGFLDDVFDFDFFG